MLRNVLNTDPAEARELFSWAMVPHLLLFAGLPLLLLWRVQLDRQSWGRALAWRLATIAGSAALLVGALLLVFQDFSAQMRNQKEVRYLITPANVLWSAGSVIAATRGNDDGEQQRLVDDQVAVDAAGLAVGVLVEVREDERRHPLAADPGAACRRTAGTAGGATTAAFFELLDAVLVVGLHLLHLLLELGIAMLELLDLPGHHGERLLELIEPVLDIDGIAALRGRSRGQRENEGGQEDEARRNDFHGQQ